MRIRSSFAWLVQVYTLIIIAVVALATTALVVSNVRTFENSTKQAEGALTMQMTALVEQHQEAADNLANGITARSNGLDNIRHYFSDSIAAYSDYAITQSIPEGQYFFWPSESRQFFIQHGDVTRLTLQMAAQKDTFVATAATPGGKLEKGQLRSGVINAPLINPYTLQADAVIGLDFDRKAVSQRFDQINGVQPLQMLLTSNTGQILYTYTGSQVSTTQRSVVAKAKSLDSLRNLTQYTPNIVSLGNGNQLVVLTDRAAIRQAIISKTLTGGALGLLFALALSGGLWAVFRQYRRQLDAVVTTVQAVGDGDLTARVAMTPANTDLRVLADGINAMLEQIHAHINTIYQLQAAQETARVHALQAQINPHFMSNTLEYIRMMALDVHQPELAKVVYYFAALMRNGTDFSPTTTLAKEAAFVDKYVYLYQVRFPERLAYQISLDPAVAELTVPRFTLQPLVENYFVHGVDFTRQDNALHVTLEKSAGGITIRVRNNGKPLTAAQVAELNANMKQPLASETRQSIGLQNVYARLRDYFGAGFAMWLESDGQAGVVTTITIQTPGNEGGDRHD